MKEKVKYSIMYKFWRQSCFLESTCTDTLCLNAMVMHIKETNHCHMAHLTSSLGHYNKFLMPCNGCQEYISQIVLIATNKQTINL